MSSSGAFAYCALCLVLGKKHSSSFLLSIAVRQMFFNISHRSKLDGELENISAFRVILLVALTVAIYYKAFCKVCRADFSSTTASCLPNKQEEMNTVIAVKNHCFGLEVMIAADFITLRLCIV